MKKILGFLAVILAAYLTAFYTKGKQNGYDKPFDFSMLDSLFSNKAISDGPNETILSGEELLKQKNPHWSVIIMLIMQKNN